MKVDACKDVRDKAIAMKVYAIQAKDRALAADAAEYRARSERRLGELMAAAPKNEGGRPWLQNNRGNESPSYIPTLAEQGIDKDLARPRVRLRPCQPTSSKSTSRLSVAWLSL